MDFWQTGQKSRVSCPCLFVSWVIVLTRLEQGAVRKDKKKRSWPSNIIICGPTNLFVRLLG
jgi:hypothetical protein